mgnify:CR=1 FL=1
MKTPIFTGACVAIVTPYNENGIDFDKLGELIERGKKKGNLSSSELMDVLEDMDGILDKSHAVTPEEWAHRGLLRRMFEPILRVFSIWM